MSPATPQEMAEALAQAASRKQTIALGGAFSKAALGGPVNGADVQISTANLADIVEYEPRDLTISVGAGMPWRKLAVLLKENKQMIPLDPPGSDDGTVGGVLASNLSGPRRRVFGAGRDLVIGMKFATLEGKVVQSGGMVVKNVAGLDMCKILIGSFGTLAAIVTANFKLLPMPPHSGTFLVRFKTVAEAVARRDQILRGVLQPSAIDLLNPKAAKRLGLDGFVLALNVGGSEKLLGRYKQELSDATLLSSGEENEFWFGIEQFAPRFMAEFPGGAVVRVSRTLQDMADVVGDADVPVLARAGNGVCYAAFEDATKAAANRWGALVEWASPEKKKSITQWPSPGKDFTVMQGLKSMFDPNHLLNKGRLYGRI